MVSDRGQGDTKAAAKVNSLLETPVGVASQSDVVVEALSDGVRGKKLAVDMLRDREVEIGAAFMKADTERRCGGFVGDLGDA